MKLSTENKLTIVLAVLACIGTVAWYFIVKKVEKPLKECEKIEIEISNKYERLRELRGKLKVTDYETHKETFQSIIADSSVTNAQLNDLKTKRNTICD